MVKVPFKKYICRFFHFVFSNSKTNVNFPSWRSFLNRYRVVISKTVTCMSWTDTQTDYKKFYTAHYVLTIVLQRTLGSRSQKFAVNWVRVISWVHDANPMRFAFGSRTRVRFRVPSRVRGNTISLHTSLRLEQKRHNWIGAWLVVKLPGQLSSSLPSLQSSSPSHSQLALIQAPPDEQLTSPAPHDPAKSNIQVCFVEKSTRPALS